MIFSNKMWGAKYIYNPGEIKKQIDSFLLQGRVIREIKAIGMDYMHREEDIEDAAYYLLEEYNCTNLYEDSEFENISEDLPFGRYMEIDQPLIIQFENGDTFEIASDWSPLYAMNMNTLSLDIEPAINYQNVDANIIFSNCIGEEINKIEIVKTRIGIDEGDHPIIVCLEKGTEYVSRIILWLSNDVGISISPYYDFTHVECIDKDNNTIQIPFGELKKALHNIE